MSSTQERRNRSRSVLVVRNLTARAAGTPILEDVSFTLRSGVLPADCHDSGDVDGSTSTSTSSNVETVPGDIAFIRGPSGGGKTALLRTVASLEPVDEVRESFDSRIGKIFLARKRRKADSLVCD